MTSSAPQEASTTRRPSIGSARSRSASATSTATAVRLSLAPGTIGLRATSSNTAVPRAEPATPAAMSPRRPRSGSQRHQRGSAHQGPPQRQRRVDPLDDPGERLAPATAGGVSSKILPVGAASWWASSTSVRGAIASPQEPTTFQVVRVGLAARRNSRGPLETSSAIGGHHRAGDGAGHRAGAAAGQRGHAGEAAGHRQRAHHARVAVAELLLLDVGVTAGGAQPLSDPVRRPALALGSGAALERRQRLDHLAQRGLVVAGQGAGRLRTPSWSAPRPTTYASTFSKIAASPWPPPMHIVSRP